MLSLQGKQGGGVYNKIGHPPNQIVTNDDMVPKSWLSEGLMIGNTCQTRTLKAGNVLLMFSFCLKIVTARADD
jgi:hypothetical protein